MNIDNKNLTSQQICKRALMVKKMQSLGDPKFKEYHETVYTDGIWTIDLEVHQYGQVRFWVSREDKHGNFNQSLFTMYRLGTGEIKYNADYVIKKGIVDKLTKTFEYMEKCGLVA